MYKTVLLCLIIFIFYKCKNENISQIEIRKIDIKILKWILTDYDSLNLIKDKSKDFPYIINIKKNKLINGKILKDSLLNIVGIVLEKSGIVYYSEEFYTNG